LFFTLLGGLCHWTHYFTWHRQSLVYLY